MTPQEKAKELVNKFHEHSYNPNPLFNTTEEASHDKQCALIAVDEVLENIPAMIDAYFPVFGGGLMRHAIPNEINNYWQQVKQEIEKL